MAFAWLLIAVAIGLALTLGAPDGDVLRLMWIYGVAGLVGFLAQMVAGVQGRLVPLYAWYRASASGVQACWISSGTRNSRARMLGSPTQGSRPLSFMRHQFSRFMR